MSHGIANAIEPARTLPSEKPAHVGKAALWTGRVLSVVLALMLLLDAVMKFVQPQQVVEATTKLGFPESSLIGLGITLLSCTIVYLIPQTAVLGAILLTGYLGGAVAAHVRNQDPLYTVMAPGVFGALLWLGLLLRDARLRLLLPWRR